MSQTDGTQTSASRDTASADTASADTQSSTDAGRRELVHLRERMSVIKGEVAADVERKWTTPWRTPDVFELKVQTRLSGHTEYRSLRARLKQIEADLAVLPDSGAGKPDA